MTDWKQKTLDHWQLIDTLAARRFSDTGLAEEAALYVFEGLAANNFKRVQAYEGRSQFKTFLSSLSWRLLEDFSRKRFGRVRTPTWINKLGSIWPLLYRLLCLERFSLDETVEILHCRRPQEKREDLESTASDLLGKIPDCGKASYVEVLYDDELAADSSFTPTSQLEKGEKELFFQVLFDSLLNQQNGTKNKAIRQNLARILDHDFALTPEETLLLTLCFKKNMPVAKAGRMLDLNRFQVHGRLKRIMTRIPINKSQKANRKTALMVLAAKGEDVKMDNCPLPEEMALLVEGKINGEEKEKILAHVSKCENCFEEWFTIAETREEKKYTSLLHLNRRFLSYAGSALAAAASIVVFLNVSHQPIMDKHLLPSPSISYESERKSKLKNDSILLEEAEKDSAGQSLQEPQIGRQAAPYKSKKESVPLRALQTAPAEDLEKLAMPSAQSVKRKELHAKKAVLEDRIQDIPLTTYLNELRFGCSGKIKPGEFWLRQLAFGEKQFPYYFIRHPQVNALLLQLSREEAQEEQCRLLLEELVQ